MDNTVADVVDDGGTAGEDAANAGDGADVGAEAVVGVFELWMGDVGAGDDAGGDVCASVW